VVERSADGAALRMLGTRMDISERKQAEAGSPIWRFTMG
jgi:PAS domain-containing protein